MNTYNFHTNLYDLAFLGTVFVGLTFALLLWFTKNINQVANRFLGLALAIIVLWIVRILGIDLQLSAYQPHWDWLTLQFSLALGPLIYFYVLKITQPDYKFRLKDMLHFSPLSLGLPAQLAFQQLNTVTYLSTFISVIIYLYLSHELIACFYRELKFNEVNDRYRYQLRWLHRLLTVFALLWLLWIPLTSLNYYYHLGIHLYYPLYLLLSITLIWIAAVAHSRSETVADRPVSRPLRPAQLKQKGTWLKKVVKENGYYQDPELSLSSLAQKIEIPPHELSRIINTVLKRSFNDFINEYRVADVIRRMQDRSNDHITLLGIAFESGFNAQSSFSRVFKQITGKSPLEYKNELKKDFPFYNLRSDSRMTPVILNRETPAKWSHDKLTGNFMFRNYLKNAWRHIMRHKTYSAINVMGLALGICGCLVIYLIASFEFSFDTFHPDKERIYCVDISSTGGADPSLAHWNAVPGTMPDAMRNDMSGLETVAALHVYRPNVKIKSGDKTARIFDVTAAVIAQPDYFDILPYTWLSGSKKTALVNPMTVVLTQSRAQTYFGNLRPDQMIGKTIIYDDSLTVTVTGILQDWNKNSDFNFSDFISYSTIKSSFLKHKISLDNPNVIDGGSEMLVKLPPNVNPAQINAQFPAFLKKYNYGHPNPDMHAHARLQPFTGIHFHKEYGGNGNKADLRVLYILSAVAVFILFIAAINFINLSTAQSIQRTKDIGILKVLGSGRGGILFQFLTETFILALLAVAIAVIAIRPLLSWFAEYIPAGVKFDFADYTTWIFLAGIATFTTLLAGFYPAKVLSAFHPASSLKGEASHRTGNKGYLRKSLTVFQFTISLIFIIGTIVVDQQVNYMQNVDLGVKTSNIITLRSLFGDQTGKVKVLAENIKQLPGIEQVITEVTPLMGITHMMDAINLQGSNEQKIESNTYSGNENFASFYQMKIVAGRNLLPTDSATEYLINVTAAKAMGFTDPQQAIGRLLTSTARNKAYPIVGVVADFYENSFYQQILPCTIANNPDVRWGIALKLTPAEYQKGDIALLVNKIAKEWKKLYPKEPFEYAFLGDSIAKLYESEQQTQWLMRSATFITIFISCMGLFGLAMFTTRRRTKEISIRKAMGASVTSILTMLNKEIVVLITISLLISSPIAWYFIHEWLQNFAYHTHLNLLVFIIGGAGTMLTALATISFLTISSATANPVKGLRNE